MHDNEKCNPPSTCSATEPHDNLSEPGKQVDKPFWKSTKAVVYGVTLGTLILFAYTNVDTEVTRTIAEAILFGLPLILGAQGAMDWAAMRRGKK